MGVGAAAPPSAPWRTLIRGRSRARVRKRRWYAGRGTKEGGVAVAGSTADWTIMRKMGGGRGCRRSLAAGYAFVVQCL